MDAAHFFRSGWARFAHDPAVADWAARAYPVAQARLEDPALRTRWLRCGGTWFAGVKVFSNDASGAVPEDDVPALAGEPVRFIADVLELTGIAWDSAQVSICFPGYPKPSAGESDAAYRFRRDRDAAHVDGLRRYNGRRRRLGEQHGFILGLPLTDAPADAAPLVVWEGSHEVMRAALRARLAGLPPERWAAEDVTDAYVEARRQCFETCLRVPVQVRSGEAYLIHRLALHGVARWPATVTGATQRAVVYFRPDPFPGATPDWWLARP